MNEEAMTIISSLWFQGEVKMIVFSQDKSLWHIEDDGWGGVVDSVRKIVQGATQALEKKIFKANIDMKEKLETVQVQNEQLKVAVDEIGKS